MNLVSVKNLSEVHLNGVSIDWTREDKTIKEISLHDGNGGHVFIKLGESYTNSLKVMVPQPFEEEDRWHLSGKLAGLTDISEHFADEYEAKERLREYERQIIGETGLSIAKVKVKVNDTGKVVAGDDIPF